MDGEMITEIRSRVMLAMEDLGGVATRLREIEELSGPACLNSNMVEEAEMEIVNWLDSAAAILAEASDLAFKKEAVE